MASMETRRVFLVAALRRKYSVGDEAEENAFKHEEAEAACNSSLARLKEAVTVSSVLPN